MASLNSPSLMLKRFVGSFSLAIVIAFALTFCEAKNLETLSQNPKSPLDTNNGDAFSLPQYKMSIKDSMSAVSKSSNDLDEIKLMIGNTKNLDNNLESALTSCRQLLSLTSYTLNQSLPNGVPRGETLVDMKTYLCGSLAYIETCSDAFQNAPESIRKVVTATLDGPRKNVKDSLTILSTVKVTEDSFSNGGMNAWSPSSEVLLNSTKRMYFNVVVAQDGSGRFRTISEAINSAPEYSQKRYVIYVKKGRYYERVWIDEKKWNIVMIGDGMDKTIVSGNRCNKAGYSTTDSSTFVVHGRGFIARDMGFENTAGAAGGQAVAVLSTSDQSIFYRCSISGFQDTLCPLSNRQFYRDCRISGTVDFIFGQAAAVFQGCTILARKPIHGQSNTITAHSKSDSRCQCGFSFHRGYVYAAENLAGARTFLGRPWRDYATVVFMANDFSSLIDPEGWLAWSGVSRIPDTVYYGEWGNRGPSARIGGRVQGRGIRPRMSITEARSFTVKAFIGGHQWIPSTGIPVRTDL